LPPPEIRPCVYTPLYPCVQTLSCAWEVDLDDEYFTLIRRVSEWIKLHGDKRKLAVYKQIRGKKVDGRWRRNSSLAGWCCDLGQGDISVVRRLPTV